MSHVSSCAMGSPAEIGTRAVRPPADLAWTNGAAAVNLNEIITFRRRFADGAPSVDLPVMKPSFLARPVRLFGSTAVLVLCVIFFLTPFALRGARMSIERMENNVKDWLPSDFPETRDLEWFGKHFMGDRFVLVTWPGCNEADPRYELMVKKLRAELAPVDQEQEIVDAMERAGDDEGARTRAAERAKTRQMGDRLALFATGDYYQDWGGRNEKWLQGDDGVWYFITPEGELYRWNGKPNFPGWLSRSVEKLIKGINSADGELIATVGEPSTPDHQNEYHADPRKLTARLFKTLTTGPGVVERLASEGGSLWPIGRNVADEDKSLIAHRQAYERLTGVLFGPPVPAGFSWGLEAFRNVLPPEKRAELPAGWEETYSKLVKRVIEEDYGGDRQALVDASSLQQARLWDALFLRFHVAPPPRQTCLVLTLSEAGKRDMRRVIGRPLLGKPQGRLLAMAENECNLPAEELRMGGPPVDNVAIDEEGTITLFRLIGYSAFLGIFLSYLCFRSVQVTTMVFFVGGVSAVASLSIVWWGGSSVDAILMSMPSLVYVLGLSGAVHIVNYYREAVKDGGVAGAPERALWHGWFPCTLAAFTTALGLLSLCSSSLTPIRKFGFFSAIGVMATLTLLFTYLPAALHVFPPGYDKRRKNGDENAKTSLSDLVTSFWEGVGRRVVRHHGWVAFACVALCIVVGWGLRKTDTDVQLLKLFDADAKIIRDYKWMEPNLGKLVPMELVIRVAPQMVRPTLDDLKDADEEAKSESRFQLSFLERLELVKHVQHVVQDEFGEYGQQIVGQGMSALTYVPDLPAPGSGRQSIFRNTFNSLTESHREELLKEDSLGIDRDVNHLGSELWRVSLRLGALNDVDYGVFVHEQKLAVEPVLSAYRYREEILRKLDEHTNGKSFSNVMIGFLGVGDPKNGPTSSVENDDEQEVAVDARDRSAHIDQTHLFTSSLRELLENRNFRMQPTKKDPRGVRWHDPVKKPPPDEFATSEGWANQLGRFDCVVLVRDHPCYDLDFIRQHSKLFIDARDHLFHLGKTPSAADRDDPIQVVYTGVVPVVYKAQRTLLNSLFNSIALAFVMIAVVMMFLLRDSRRRLSLTNVVNVRGGMLSMLPNIFPVVLVFGAMGHLGIKVDIGTMMCASVAMGVAVDDTIHYLTWFRYGIRTGLDRNAAIIEAYRRVGTAMTQTTLIGGLGLAVFALSTFTPTQRFGIMMITILAAALVGDLVFLPALLAGPLGRCFCPRSRLDVADEGDAIEAEPATVESPDMAAPAAAVTGDSSPPVTPHSPASKHGSRSIRKDPGHNWLRRVQGDR
ncbi:MAG: RND family transporter [Pirellulaceae bacterium]